jgi:hypothetical protein
MMENLPFYLNPSYDTFIRMRLCLRQVYMCLIPTFCVIGVPLLVYGGLSLPYSLTNEEAYAAGVNQPQALEEKRRNSVEYREMLIGMCMLTMWRCPSVVIEPEEQSTPRPDSSP